MTALQVKNLGKAYRAYASEWFRVARWFGLPFRPKEEHWVLRHVSFDVRPGDALGVIGVNGAGKSTLLKLITGTLQPTEGEVHVRGSVSAILELGMGFNGDLTGRENARHAAGLMGHGAEEIEAILPEIESFAEIGDYFDLPVRTYSSGMQMRVAFAVATAFRPDILIVDEALSVGDAYFQHKSFERIRDYNAQGTALLMVSHDKAAIQSICQRAILLDHGELLREDTPEKVFDLYNTLLSRHQEQQVVEETKASDGGHQLISGSGEATIERIELLAGASLAPLEVVRVGEAIQFRLWVKIHQPIETLVVGCGVKDRLGQMMFGTNTFHTNQVLKNLSQGDDHLITIDCAANLNEGSYSLHASLVSGETHLEHNYCWVERGLIFEVINTDKPFFVGSAWNEMRFKTHRLSLSDAAAIQPPVVRDLAPNELPPLVIIDVGCRWGFAERFSSMPGQFQIFGFDPDAEECQRLETLYATPWVTLVPQALSGVSGPRKLHVTQEPACSSLLKPRAELASDYPALSCIRTEKIVEVHTTTLDEWALDAGLEHADWIKVDTQGTELEILKGGINLLRTVRAIEVEVEFNPIYQDQPLFSHVDLFLREQGFVLWKITNPVHYSKHPDFREPMGRDSIYFNDDISRIDHTVFGGQFYWANAHYVRQSVFSESSTIRRALDDRLFEALGMSDVIRDRTDCNGGQL